MKSERKKELIPELIRSRISWMKSHIDFDSYWLKRFRVKTPKDKAHKKRLHKKISWYRADLKEMLESEKSVEKE